MDATLRMVPRLFFTISRRNSLVRICTARMFRSIMFSSVSSLVRANSPN